MAVRRMMARRRKPANIWLDNGTNFALKHLDNERIVDQLSTEKVPWHFNRPSSLHFGGAWECLVQSAKRVLKAVVGKQCVNDEMLLTFMAEVESLMNGRPLTHVSTDYRDEEALTPNHFLLGRANPNFLPDVVNDKDLCNRKRAFPGDNGRVRAAEIHIKTGTYIRPVNKQRTAHIFNQFFTNVADNIPEPDPSLYGPDFLHHHSIKTITSHMGGNPSTDFCFNNTTPAVVIDITKSLPASKAISYDDIPTRLVKDSISILARPLCTLFNSSIASNCFPTC
ncbi:hypothetical protein P5673_011910 [Acropora cervicornis]|uniref:Integrase catalytic domain-containing protein n=1 Tax=Acropora cervicornis TaxID=6130 RepID=A0AAD9V7U6_ACRCE|nr:hypothetical protein P5673_011910 [Acropora cervicornis]